MILFVIPAAPTRHFLLARSAEAGIQSVKLFQSKGVPPPPTPVSYTHLDVYKRQPWWFRPPAGAIRPLAVYPYPSRWPFRVMDNRGSAGFYASAWGALPFTVSFGPLERYTLFEVVGASSPVEGKQ